MLDILLLLCVSIILLIALTVLIKSLIQAKRKIKLLDHSIRSQSVISGLNFEQWVPLSVDYPYDPRQFRFLGNPIDGIQFEEDKIILLEFKSGKSKLSSKQNHIKHLVEIGKVEFLEVRQAPKLT